MTVKKIQCIRTSAAEMIYNVHMAVLEIKKYPEKILKQKTTLIQNIDGVTQQLIDSFEQYGQTVIAVETVPWERV